ncbi:hypothetical protein BDV96DRAFT_137539 [Lophiotrema nucula]|uniref:Uncharacterized protein n=1 Tax=Lophiotrema nucula TaxID=690887 RepID=A0A6A5ZSA6_9PLEO|nr:hypothetical protein BDV96DRAFT_137539 [Lophiotrema nucula]
MWTKTGQRLFYRPVARYAFDVSVLHVHASPTGSERRNELQREQFSAWLQSMRLRDEDSRACRISIGFVSWPRDIGTVTTSYPMPHCEPSAGWMELWPYCCSFADCIVYYISPRRVPFRAFGQPQSNNIIFSIDPNPRVVVCLFHTPVASRVVGRWRFGHQQGTALSIDNMSPLGANIHNEAKPCAPFLMAAPLAQNRTWFAD